MFEVILNICTITCPPNSISHTIVDSLYNKSESIGGRALSGLWIDVLMNIELIKYILRIVIELLN